mmetsp:Transcript_4666/g.10959  ORF Transcript_4666/g.10959 Transcript_4666/m.10959 type:complete len:119 (-) Transcript_4666:85-441(-)
MEQEAKDWREAQEMDVGAQAARLREFKETQKAQNKAVAAHHKGLLDVEKELHGRTMERTMARVARHMRLGDGDKVADAPTRDFLRCFPLPSPRPPGTSVPTGPLQRAGAAALLAEVGD